MDLPAKHVMTDCADLEASAARALDLEAPRRLVAILHADDPVLLASSRGALQQTLDLVDEWALLHNAQFHHSTDKTVVMVSSALGAEDLDLQAVPRLSMVGRDGQRVFLEYKQVHKWLGVRWSSNLVFTASLIAPGFIAPHPHIIT